MDIKKFLAIDFDTPGAKIFDWGLSFACIAYGLWASSPLWIAGGAVGLVASWYRPLTRLQRYLDGFFTRQR